MNSAVGRCERKDVSMKKGEREEWGKKKTSEGYDEPAKERERDR